MRKMASHSASHLKSTQLDSRSQDLLGKSALRSSDLSQVVLESNLMKSVMTFSESVMPDSHADLSSAFSNSTAVCGITNMLDTTRISTISTHAEPLATDKLKGTEIPPTAPHHELETSSLPDTYAGVSCVLAKSDVEPSPATQPKISHQDEPDSVCPDLSFRTCEDNRREDCRGLRMRARHFEVTDPRTEDVLEPVSDPQEVLIRARHVNNAFLVNKNSIPSMSIIHVEQLCQATFQKQEFFHETQCRVVTTFLHVPSQSYLGVCPDTQEVKFIKRVSSSENEGAISMGVASLNGPCGPYGSPSLKEESWQEADPCCHFIVINEGHTCVKPAICDTMSLDYTNSGSSVQVVHGRKWSFSLLPADQAEKYLNTKDLKKLLKKAMFIVLVTRQKE